MFAGKTLWQIFASGGVTMYVLLFCSLLSLAVIIDRLWTYWSMMKVSRAGFMRRIQAMIERKDREGAIEVCRETRAPFARVAMAGLELRSRDEKLLASTLERAVTVQASRLSRLTSVVGTIGNTAVYIGLFGTVLGIIRAFRDISAMGPAEWRLSLEEWRRRSLPRPRGLQWPCLRSSHTTTSFGALTSS